jgi:hypothetical protein
MSSLLSCVALVAGVIVAWELLLWIADQVENKTRA